MSDAALGLLSDRLFLVTVLLYTLAMLAFAGEQAARRSRQVLRGVRRAVSASAAAAGSRTGAMRP